LRFPYKNYLFHHRGTEGAEKDSCLYFKNYSRHLRFLRQKDIDKIELAAKYAKAVLFRSMNPGFN